MNKDTNDIRPTNEDIIRSIAKKVITNTSSEDFPFNEMVFSKTNAGYGFSLQDEGKFLAVRALNGRLMVHVSNQGSDYKKNFLISDIQPRQLKTKSAEESYKKYCINTCYTIIKTWNDCPKYKRPDLGDETLYKF